METLKSRRQERGFDFPLCRLSLLRLSVLFPSFTLSPSFSPPFQSLHQTTQPLLRTLTSSIIQIPYFFTSFYLESAFKVSTKPQFSRNEHRFSLAIRGPSASVLLALHPQCMNIQKTVCFLESIQSSHDTHRRKDFCVPTPGLQSLSLSSALGLATSESLDDSSTSPIT